MSYRSSGRDRGRCARSAGRPTPGRSARPVHALHGCECQRHTGHRGIPKGAARRERPVYVHARRRTSTGGRGRRTPSLTRATPTPVRPPGPGDASPRPDGAGSRCTLRAHRHVQATANGNPGPPPSYRVSVTLGVPYRTATGTPTGQRSNAPRYGNGNPQRRAFVREAGAGPNAEGDTERRTPREGGCPWCERQGRAQGQQRAQMEQERARGGKARGYCEGGKAVKRRAEALGSWDFDVTPLSREKSKSVLGGGVCENPGTTHPSHLSVGDVKPLKPAQTLAPLDPQASTFRRQNRGTAEQPANPGKASRPSTS